MDSEETPKIDRIDPDVKTEKLVSLERAMATLRARKNEIIKQIGYRPSAKIFAELVNELNEVHAAIGIIDQEQRLKSNNL